MSSRDIYHELNVVTSLTPAARTATANGTGVDLSGYSGAFVVVAAGAWTDATHTFSIDESDDNSSFTAAAAGDVQGAAVVSSSGTASKSYRMAYMGLKRYIRVTQTVSGSPTSGAIIGASVIRSASRVHPVA